jgi:molecular chaperone DnaJ
VKIPQGIENESSLRLRGEGDAGESGTSAGDLYVVCHVLPHKVFTREEGDLHCSVSLDMASAALGTTLQVQTIDGSGAEVSIPAGTQNGTTLKLKGKGVPVMGASARGNELVTVNVTIPIKLTEKQKELLKQFKQVEDEKKKGFFKF